MQALRFLKQEIRQERILSRLVDFVSSEHLGNEVGLMLWSFRSIDFLTV